MDPRRPREGKQTVLWTLTITSGSRNMPIPAVMEPKLRTDLFCRGHMDQRTGKNRLHGPTGHQKKVFYTGNGTAPITVMGLRYGPDSRAAAAGAVDEAERERGRN